MRNNWLITTAVIAISVVLTPFAQAKTKQQFPIQHWVTDRGAQIYFLPTTDLPIVDIRVAFAAGSARDGQHPGLATLTNALLNQGTRSKSADDIAEGFDSVGAQYSSDVARDMAIVSLRSLTEPKLFEPTLALFTDVLAHANFPKKAWLREKNQQLAAIQAEKQSPADIAANQFYATLYNKHPYGHPMLGTAQSVKNISRKDVQRFYENFYNTQNATIAIVGHINKKQAQHIAQTLGKQLRMGRIAPPLENMPPLAESVEENILYPAEQTNIRLGQLGIDRHSVDYFPLIVGNYTLGGGSLVSRLFDQVREKRGLSYSAYSRFIPMAATGPFIVSLGTRTNQADKALGVTKTVLRHFINEGPTEAELTAAKKNINGSFALRLDSNRALADNILAIGFYRLPIDYLDTYQQKVQAVTRQHIRKAFQRHLHPDKMIIIQVGKQKQSQTASTANAKKT